jgi:(p)ppGpp synthase/HD superfamily hydrolase
MRATLARRQARGAPHAQLQPITWDEIQPITYLLRLEIYGHDHLGLMNEVSAAVAHLGLPIARSLASANQDRNKAAIVMTVAIPPTMRRDTVIRRLRSAPGVNQVERETRKGCVREGE